MIFVILLVVGVLLVSSVSANGVGLDDKGKETTFKIVEIAEPTLQVVSGYDPAVNKVHIMGNTVCIVPEDQKALQEKVNFETSENMVEVDKAFLFLDAKFVEGYCFQFTDEKYVKYNPTIVNQTMSMVQFIENDLEINVTLRKWNGNEFVIAPEHIWIQQSGYDNYKFGANDTYAEEDTSYQYEWISSNEIIFDNNTKQYYIEEQQTTIEDNKLKVYPRKQIDLNDICTFINESHLNYTFNPNCTYQHDNNTLHINFTARYDDQLDLVFIDPAISNSADAIYHSGKKLAHYGNGYYWMAYYSGSNVTIASSSDGTTWTDQGTPFTTNPTVSNWDIKFSGNKAIGIRTTGGSSGARTLEIDLNSDGTFTAGTERNTIDQATHRVYPNIEFIGSNKNSIGVATRKSNSEQIVRIEYCSGTDSLTDCTGGLEATEWTVSTVFLEKHILDLSSIAEGDFYVITAATKAGDETNTDRHTMRGNYYDNSTSSLATQDIISDNTNTPRFDAFTTPGIMSTTVNSTGDIHIVYRTSTNRMAHKTIAPDTGGGTVSTVSSDITSSGTINNMFLTITDDDIPYLFYDLNDEKIYYRTFESGSWSSATEIKSDTTTLQSPISGYTIETNEEIGIMYVNGSSAPYDVSFQTISLATGGDTCDCSSIQAGTTIDCTENCDIDACNAGSLSMITFSGAGTVTINGLLENFDKANITNGCAIDCDGGCFDIG